MPDGRGFQYDPSDSLIFCSLDCTGQVANDFPMLVRERATGQSFSVDRAPVAG